MTIYMKTRNKKDLQAQKQRESELGNLIYIPLIY